MDADKHGFSDHNWPYRPGVASRSARGASQLRALAARGALRHDAPRSARRTTSKLGRHQIPCGFVNRRKQRQQKILGKLKDKLPHVHPERKVHEIHHRDLYRLLRKLFLKFRRLNQGAIFVQTSFILKCAVVAFCGRRCGCSPAVTDRRHNLKRMAAVARLGSTSSFGKNEPPHCHN
jgi:hypothetical protein